jgi:hypothetical protein
MKILVTIILCFTLFSCYDHLNEKVYEGKDFTVKWYSISTITTLDEYIDLEKYGSTENIMQCSSLPSIYDIVITGDTIIIKTTPRVSISDLVAKKKGCIIKLDSTITMYQYMKKYHPEVAAEYIGDTIN